MSTTKPTTARGSDVLKEGLVDTEGAASVIGCSVAVVRNLCFAGRLHPEWKWSGKPLFTEDEVRRAKAERDRA